jgi:hypothetical protein
MDERPADEARMNERPADEARMGEATVECHTAMEALRGGGNGQKPKQADNRENTRQVHNAPRDGLFGHVSDIRQGLMTRGAVEFAVDFVTTAYSAVFQVSRK